MAVTIFFLNIIFKFFKIKKIFNFLELIPINIVSFVFLYSTFEVALLFFNVVDGWLSIVSVKNYWRFSSGIQKK